MGTGKGLNGMNRWAWQGLDSKLALRAANSWERLTYTEGGSQFRNLAEGQNVRQSVFNTHFVLSGQWGQMVQLIIYEKKKTRNLEGLCFSLS